MKGAGSSNEGADGVKRERSPRRVGAPAEAGGGKGADLGRARPPAAYVGHVVPKGVGKKGYGKKGRLTPPWDRIDSVTQEKLQREKLTVVEEPPRGGVLQPRENATPDGGVNPELEGSTPGRRWAGRVVDQLLALLPPHEDEIGAALIVEAAGGRMTGPLGQQIKKETAGYVDKTFTPLLG